MDGTCETCVYFINAAYEHAKFGYCYEVCKMENCKLSIIKMNVDLDFYCKKYLNKKDYVKP